MCKHRMHPGVADGANRTAMPIAWAPTRTQTHNDDTPRKAGRRWQRRVCGAYFFFGMYRSVMVPS